MRRFSSSSCSEAVLTSSGRLANWNSVGSLDEGETANVGILDGRFAVDWVKANIAVRFPFGLLSRPSLTFLHQQAFGGDPNNIAIAGQSGGGGAIMSQLVLYDGKKPNYQKAIARSIQNYAAYTLEELTVRLLFLLFPPLTPIF